MAAGSLSSGGSRTASGYRGLFSPRYAPVARPYCILFSFTGGVLLITAGSVFCNVIARHPVSGGRPMHTPPLPLAVSTIVAGVVMVVACIIVIWRCGMDEGDESLDEDHLQFCTDDQLDHMFQQQQMLFQQYIQRQIQKHKLEKSNSEHCCHCSAADDVSKSVCACAKAANAETEPPQQEVLLTNKPRVVRMAKVISHTTPVHSEENSSVLSSQLVVSSDLCQAVPGCSHQSVPNGSQSSMVGGSLSLLSSGGHSSMSNGCHQSFPSGTIHPHKMASKIIAKNDEIRVVIDDS